MKTLTILIAMALAANAALAQNPGFDILGTDPILMTPIDTVTILIAATSGNCGGMSLALQALGNFEIVGLQVTGFPGAYWTGKTNGVPQIGLYPKEEYGSSYATADVSTSLSNHIIPNGALVARVTIAPIFPGAPIGLMGTLTTNADVQPSSLAPWGAATTTYQDSIGLLIPEPTTALLLLAALPLIRRRSRA